MAKKTNNVKKAEKIGELRIRNVEPSVVAKFTQLAKKNGKNRNDYIKSCLESFVVLETLKAEQEKNEALIKSLSELVEENTKVLLTVTDLLNEIRGEI